MGILKVGDSKERKKRKEESSRKEHELPMEVRSRDPHGPSLLQGLLQEASHDELPSRRTLDPVHNMPKRQQLMAQSSWKQSLGARLRKSALSDG